MAEDKVIKSYKNIYNYSKLARLASTIIEIRYIKKLFYLDLSNTHKKKLKNHHGQAFLNEFCNKHCVMRFLYLRRL